jgi:hypothetical protein
VSPKPPAPAAQSSPARPPSPASPSPCHARPAAAATSRQTGRKICRAADALGGDAGAFGEAVFAHADGVEKFLRQHFAGRDGSKQFCQGKIRLAAALANKRLRILSRTKQLKTAAKKRVYIPMQ